MRPPADADAQGKNDPTPALEGRRTSVLGKWILWGTFLMPATIAGGFAGCSIHRLLTSGDANLVEEEERSYGLDELQDGESLIGKKLRMTVRDAAGEHCPVFVTFLRKDEGIKLKINNRTFLAPPYSELITSVTFHAEKCELCLASENMGSVHIERLCFEDAIQQASQGAEGSVTIVVSGVYENMGMRLEGKQAIVLEDNRDLPQT